MTDIFTFTNFENVLKGLIIGLEILYCLFSFIIIRQTKLMNASFTTKAGALFMGFARIHFLFAVGLVILSILLF